MDGEGGRETKSEEEKVKTDCGFFLLQYFLTFKKPLKEGHCLVFIMSLIWPQPLCEPSLGLWKKQESGFSLEK